MRRFARGAFPSPGGGWQAHHLIPRAARSHAIVGPHLHALEAHGFDLEDFVTNGIMLPSTETEASASGLPLHRGPHPRYSMTIIRSIVPVSYGWMVRNDPSSDVTTLRKMQARLRSALAPLTMKTHERIAPRNPFASYPGIEKLDARADRMFDELLLRSK